MKLGVVEKIRAAGGELYAITSEPQHLADQAREHWELDFESVGDPHQEISRTCRERGWLSLYVNEGNLDYLQRAASWKAAHPKGFFQPGVLAVTKEGRVLYRWRSTPSRENLGGTVARPTPKHAWSAIERSLGEESDPGDAPHDDDPVIDQPPPPRALFVAGLIANGWFLGVRPFAYSPGVPPIQTRFAIAFARWPFFLAAWLLALAFVPAGWVGLAFVGWVAWIARDARRFLVGMDMQRKLVAQD